MILDSSAVVAILLSEPDHEDIYHKILRAETVGIGAPTLTETGIVLTARLRRPAQSILRKFLDRAGVTVVSFDERHWQLSLEAFERYGKGRHPARLNFGDCLSYATAKLAGQPLLCVGNDFAQTDVELA
ncbi:type II toxin-antitoxin system VapC family toxin [soil metagenome]|jgi:ribonuclease VapC|nr:type II toxin-antitoxin system VapC family toxin [Deinococcota bacterium]